MRYLAFLAIMSLALAAAAVAGPRKGKPHPVQKAEPATAQTILKWINGYRNSPDPDRLPDAVKAMSALGLFKDLEQAGIYIGFIGGVLVSNPDKAPRLVEGMFPIPAEDQVVIIRAIAFSGLGGWKDLLERFAERMPARKALIQHHLYGKAATFETLKLEASPAHLDIMWGHYFGSGRFAGIERILSILEWAKDKNDVEKLTMGSMAKWTLANNMQQDPRLLAYCKKELARSPKATELKAVIEAAETYETGLIRKQAMGAIEELKRKGPASVRNVAWWGQAGQTALALGCIVAGALGHVEVGLPCVIGGALSTAALKYVTPQE